MFSSIHFERSKIPDMILYMEVEDFKLIYVEDGILEIRSQLYD